MPQNSSGVAKNEREGDADLKHRLLNAAQELIETPNPFAAITMSEVSERMGEAESTILYQIEAPKGTDPLVAFRQQAYVRAVERFDCLVGPPVRQATISALAAGQPLPMVLSSLCSALAIQFRNDPATRYLLGASTRVNSYQGLAEVVESSWSDFSLNVANIVRLVIAAREQSLGLDDPQLCEVIRLAIGTGWVDTQTIGAFDFPIVEIDGVHFENSGLTLWIGIRDHLSAFVEPESKS